MRALSFDLQQEAVLETLIQDVHKTSDIEGERLDLGQVRSSVASHLGIKAGGLRQVEERVEGVVEMMVDATANYDRRLTRERLWGWQTALFPSGRSGPRRIIVGGWRDDRTGPTQVSSGPLGRERVHFEAPAAGRIEHEIPMFLDWFNTESDTDWVVKSALAHLWFVTIHPFDDGNGRVARAIADMALARSERSSQRFYSMSSQIRAERNDYYRILERTQKGTTDVTDWMAGSWAVWAGLSTGQRPPWKRCSPRRASGRHRGCSPQRPAAAGAEPSPGRLRREADHLQMGQAHQMFSRHSPARHHQPHQPRNPGPRSLRRPQHQLPTGTQPLP